MGQRRSLLLCGATLRIAGSKSRTRRLRTLPNHQHGPRRYASAALLPCGRHEGAISTFRRPSCAAAHARPPAIVEYAHGFYAAALGRLRAQAAHEDLDGVWVALAVLRVDVLEAGSLRDSTSPLRCMSSDSSELVAGERDDRLSTAHARLARVQQIGPHCHCALACSRHAAQQGAQTPGVCLHVERRSGRSGRRRPRPCPPPFTASCRAP